MANKLYINPETALDWTDAGGDYALDLGMLAADAWRAGGVGDLGVPPRSEWYEWKVVIDGFETAPVVGEIVKFFIAQSDGTYIDGALSGTDGASSSVVEPNIKFLDTVSVQTVGTANQLITSGKINITSRFVVPVVHNKTADALLGTADAHHFFLTPIPPEVQ